MKPQFTIISDTVDAKYGKFIIEPLPQGFGHTLGNSLRRVLYTSIRGAAITSVQIEQANHQFTTIEGVKEDVVQLVLNLKQVRVTYTGDAPTKMTLSAKGPGEVKAGDFETEAGVKIVNPELVLATLSDKAAKLDLEATVEAGYGYSPAAERSDATVGSIVVDAMFSPVVRVNFGVEATRVGRVTNFDKLVLEITTDGSVNPQETLTSAASTLVEYFSGVVKPAQEAGAVGSMTAKTAGSSLSIEELDLPTRIANALQKAGFDTVSSLQSVPRAELAKVKNLGAKSVVIVEEALSARGISLS